MPSDSTVWPDWVQDAVFYQIFPDRFAKSSRVPKAGHIEAWDSPPTVHGYKGGDLLGVVEHLDYLSELGVNALYLNPVFASASNHRYHTLDYFRIDPMLGGGAAFRELLSAAHDRGMRVVLDGVFNHASRGLLQFNDILENGSGSAYLDWFHVHSYPLNAYGGGPLGYDAWWGLPALPKFNTETPAVREFLWRAAEYWLEQGIDGWRLDVPSEIEDDEFWRTFRRRSRAVRPDAYIVGEIWTDASRWLKGDMFDGVMNYPLTRAIYGFVARELAQQELAQSGLHALALLDAPGMVAEVEPLLSAYPAGAVASQLNLLGSHDTPRLLTSLCGDLAAVRQALLLLFAFPGAPCLYYGDEIGLTGGHDPYCRAGMPWEQRDTWDLGLLDFVKRLTRLRSEQVALRRGATRVSAPKDHLVAIARGEICAARPELLVLANSSGATSTVPVATLPLGRYRDLLTDRELTQALGAPLVPARGGLMLKPID